MDALTSLIIVAAVIVGIVALVRFIRHRRSLDWKLERALSRCSTARVAELYIPDGMDGQIHVPHVLRTAAGFVVLDVLRMDGAVFGAERIDDWTVMAGGRSNKFRNPVVANRSRVLAVELLIPGLPVHGLVLLLGDVTFPKGQPDGVVTLDTLEQRVSGLPMVAPTVVGWDEAWFGLAACATVRPDAV
jgi:hypothetical protein